MGHPHIVDPRDGLTARQRLAVDMLARGKTIRETARALNVTEKTISNYKRRPAVMRAIFNAQDDLVAQAGGQGINTIPDAVMTLQAIMADPNARDADRIAASRALISGANAYTERRILERQLRDLENLLRTYTSAETPGELPPDDEPLDPLLPSAAVPEDESE